MCESQTASNYTSDMDLPKFKVTELRRVLELLESLAVTEPQKIAPQHRLSRAPHRRRSERGWATGSEGVCFLIGLLPEVRPIINVVPASSVCPIHTVLSRCQA